MQSEGPQAAQNSRKPAGRPSCPSSPDRLERPQPEEPDGAYVTSTPASIHARSNRQPIGLRADRARRPPHGHSPSRLYASEADRLVREEPLQRPTVHQTSSNWSGSICHPALSWLVMPVMRAIEHGLHPPLTAGIHHCGRPPPAAGQHRRERIPPCDRCALKRLTHRPHCRDPSARRAEGCCATSALPVPTSTPLRQATVRIWKR